MKAVKILGLIFVVQLVVAVDSAEAAELKIASNAPMKHVLEKLSPKFEAQSGHTLTLFFASSGRIAKAVEDGTPADVLITTNENLEPLFASGKVQGPGMGLATSSVGIAVKAGAPKPSIASAEDVKATLLAARSVAFNDPGSGAASGIHFAKVLDQLGIKTQVLAKAKLMNGEPVANAVVSGDAELAVHQIPELKAVSGAEIVGPLPKPLQASLKISGAVVTASQFPDAARGFLMFLGTPEAIAGIVEDGMTAGTD